MGYTLATRVKWYPDHWRQSSIIEVDDRAFELVVLEVGHYFPDGGGGWLNEKDAYIFPYSITSHESFMETAVLGRFWFFRSWDCSEPPLILLATDANVDDAEREVSS